MIRLVAIKVANKVANKVAKRVAKKNGIKYEKYDGENYNVSFDTYWKGLYEESFKKKHVPNTEIR